MKSHLVIVFALFCKDASFGERIHLAPSLSARLSERLSKPDEYEAENATEPDLPPEPVCCARREKPKRRFGPRPVIEFKLKAPGKYCHAKSWGTNWPETVDMACCEGLDYSKKRKTEDSRCHPTGRPDCDYSNAEKAGPYECECREGTVCMQTRLPKSSDSEEYHGYCDGGKFSLQEQQNYDIMCMSRERVEPSQSSCQRFGGHLIGESHYCVCGREDVCIGEACTEQSRNAFGFMLDDAFIKGKGNLARWQRKLMAELQVEYEVGCASVTCDMFNAVGRPESCSCEPREYKYGSVAQHPRKDVDNHLFHVQVGWNEGYWCRERHDTLHNRMDHQQEGTLHQTTPECPERHHNTVGVHSINDEEPYCQCPYRYKCTGPHCEKVDDDWFYPALKMDEHDCVRSSRGSRY